MVAPVSAKKVYLWSWSLSLVRISLKNHPISEDLWQREAVADGWQQNGKNCDNLFQSHFDAKQGQGCLMTTDV